MARDFRPILLSAARQVGQYRLIYRGPDVTDAALIDMGLEY